MAVMPPSALSRVSGWPESAAMASTTSRTCQATASRAARAMWPLGHIAGEAGDHAARVRAPVRREQARERRHDTAAAVVVHRARQGLDVGGAAKSVPRLSRSHCTSEPATAMEPFQRKDRTRASPIRYAERRQQAVRRTATARSYRCWRGGRRRCRRCTCPRPGEKHVWPNSAACWSPSAEATGTPPRTPRAPSRRPPPRSGFAAAWRGERRWHVHQVASSQSSVARSIISVRLALVTSVTWRPVSFQISQLSMVPNSTSPRAAASRAPVDIVQ